MDNIKKIKRYKIIWDERHWAEVIANSEEEARQLGHRGLYGVGSMTNQKSQIKGDFEVQLINETS